MRRSDIPSLDDLRAFEAVARLGAVRAAADELALTHGAVSRRVSRLAGRIGVPLLEANGRGIRSTREGESLARVVGAAFGSIAGAVRTLQAPTTPAPITLSCERSLTMRWLIPRLSAFQDANPRIEVHLSTGGGPLDFARDRVTIAIRRLDFPVDPSWAVVELMPERTGPVMLPAARPGFERGDYIALGSQSRPTAWTAWLDRHPSVAKPGSRRFLDHHFLMEEAALGGLGVALAPQAIAMANVSAGNLEAPFGFDPDGSVYALFYPSTTTMTEELATLIQWLVETAAGARQGDI